MKLPNEGARWLVHLRWLACALVFAAVGVATQLGLVHQPLPLLSVGCGLLFCNFCFWIYQRAWSPSPASVDRHIALQVLCDVVSLSLLLYFSDLSRNPFLFFFVLPMIIAGMYLDAPVAYGFGALVAVLVGGILWLEYVQLIPRFPLHFSIGGAAPLAVDYLLMLFIALASTLGITLYFARAIRNYVDRAHEQIRQKEKMVGIGQLVAGIGHQIANPLDGVQNCLRRIGEHVKDDARLTEYVQMMEEALDRIEKTTKRVQAFARPRGLDLQDTSVNSAVESTLALLGSDQTQGITIRTELADVPSVRGDPYTLQEVLFNLCRNAIAAMPQGGSLTLRTRVLGSHEANRGHVAIDVEDTGVGIPRGQLEKIFEPFYTTRADQGGTGLGLGLCRMMISEMDGHIHVRSELNRGTTFTVILQRWETASRDTAA